MVAGELVGGLKLLSIGPDHLLEHIDGLAFGYKWVSGPKVHKWYRDQR